MRAVAGLPRRRVQSIAAMICAAVAVSGCQSSSSTHSGPEERAPGDDAPIFSSSVFGVPASPRVTNLKRVPKGGGREQVGKPYQVRGKWYYPKDEPGYTRSGKASWYGANFHGRLTANGEVYDMYHLSAAHPTFPLPSYARVTNQTNGNSVMVRVNDRGPFSHERVMDLSSQAADMLDFKQAGIADVKVEYLGKAPVDGDDTGMLMASFRPGGARSIDDGLPSGVMIASNERRGGGLFTAASYAGPSPLPGVRPMISTAPTSPIAAAMRAATPAPTAAPSPMTSESAPALNVPLPMPKPRDVVLSYAPQRVSTGSMGALAAIIASQAGERIEIGTISDLNVLARVADLADTYGRLVEDHVPAEGEIVTSLAIEAAPGSDVDAALRALWAAGATDAFVLRD